MRSVLWKVVDDQIKVLATQFQSFAGNLGHGGNAPPLLLAVSAEESAFAEGGAAIAGGDGATRVDKEVDLTREKEIHLTPDISDSKELFSFTDMTDA